MSHLKLVRSSAADWSLELQRVIVRAGEVINGYPMEDRFAYALWLAQSYYFVRHSTRLLNLGAARATFAQQVLYSRMVKHVSEESGHEKLASRDLEKLGYRLDSFAELDETRFFVRNQYFGIEKFGAEYLLGYILFLEGVAAKLGPSTVERVTAAHGAGTVGFLKLHAEEDQTHEQEALQRVRELPEETRVFVLESLQMTGTMYTHLMQKMRVLVQDQQKREMPFSTEGPKRRAAA